MRKSIWLAGLLTLAFGISAMAKAPPKTPKVDPADEKIQDLKLSDVPDDVRQVINDEKGTGKVDSVVEVKRPGEHYFKAHVEMGKIDKVVVVSAKGKLLGVWHVGPEGATRDLKFDELPDDLQAVIKKDWGRKAVKFVEFTRAERKVYGVKVIGEGWLEYNAKGQRLDLHEAHVTKEVGVKREMNFDNLPGPVKNTVGKTISGNKVERVFHVQEPGKDYYWAQSVDGRTMTVAPNGDIIKPLAYPGK